jgi:hypothetical protein
VGLLVVATGVIATRKPVDPYLGLRHQQTTPIAEAAPMCPWRTPEADRSAFFPSSARSVAETRVLSGKRLELTRRLGRAPTAEEGALHLYRIEATSGRQGTVMVRRVKGEYGAIELVLATDPRGAVRGVRIQRLREPEAVAALLRSAAWLGRFQGITAGENWNEEELLRGVPPDARASAEAVVDGIRSQLILFSVAEQSGAPAVPPHHH